MITVVSLAGACAVVVAQLSGGGAAVSASSPPPASEPRDAAASSDPPLPEGTQPRPLPEYRPSSEPPLATLLWIPRVLLAPMYVVSDMLTQPLIAVGRLAERQRWPERIQDFFTFGPDERFSLYPAIYVDLGFQSTFGAYFAWQRMWRSSELHARATTTSSGAWDVRALWEWPVDDGELRIALRYVERHDAAYHGYGGDSSAEVWRYGERGFEGLFSRRLELGRDLSLTSRFGPEWWSFEPSVVTHGDASLSAEVAAGNVPAPPAFSSGFSSLTTGARLAYDSRRGRVASAPRVAEDYAHVDGSGAALQLDLAGHWGLQPTRAQPEDPARMPLWLSYGAALAGTLDLTGTQRRLELELYAAFSDPLPGSTSVPFTRTASLGGLRPMRGFGSRRLVDSSAVVATLRYRWPVWSALDGNLHAAAGNVFGPRLRGFDLPDLRASFGLGLSTAGSSLQAFELLLAFGTVPFADGAAIESTRLTVGTTQTL